MRHAIPAALIALLATSAGAQERAPPSATATFTSPKGETVGTAKLTGLAVGVLIEVEVRGLPANAWVGFHVHETGSCDHAGGHASAGGHYNPTRRAHGLLMAGGPHAGDMPNQYVPADGVLRAHVLNTFVTLDRGATGIVGRALMIHGGTDDYRGQPAGNAGDRQACAVIRG
jgi:Cu-Zn family superoxide dismutase